MNTGILISSTVSVFPILLLNLYLERTCGNSKSPKLGLPTCYDKRYKINVSILSRDITDALPTSKTHHRGRKHFFIINVEYMYSNIWIPILKSLVIPAF